MLQQRKIARWLREIKHEPPKDPSVKPHIIQHVFRVTPPMEWVDSVVYRHGKLIKDPVHGMPNRMRVESRRMEKARLEGRTLTYNNKPRYTYGKRVHRTSFVLVSASDLKTFMNATSDKMQKLMKERGDKDGERLFQRRDHFEVETYIFPCDKWGKWKDGGELHGSQRGTLDHRVPLQDAGYTVIGMPYNLVLYGASVDQQQ